VVIGPTLYKLFGGQAVFTSVVMMYLLAAVFVGLLPRREEVQTSLWSATKRSLHVMHVWGDMLEAARFLRDSAGVTLAIGHLTVATGLLMTLATLGPGFVARVLGLGAEDVGYVLAPAGVGMLASTAMLGQYAAHADRRRLAGLGLLGMSLAIAALALVRPAFDRFQEALTARGMVGLQAGETLAYFGLVGVITIALGVAFSLVTIPAQTVVSEATTEALRGRVFALLFMVTGTVSAVPTVLVGILADNVGIVPMLLALSMTVAVFGLVALRPAPQAPTLDAAA
ncbi:MAG TPA: MFS transporter, partial [Chloroflexota bacterium]|nr:MFS transporter [Chloroflexota bacterium]